MQRIVAIPTAHRPELLALTLEKLAASKDCPEVHIYADAVSRLEDIERVRDLYFPEAFLYSAGPHISAPSGCWNILNSIKHASQFADDVYLVEEDVLVYPWFFSWHAKQVEPASCGRVDQMFWKHYPGLYTNPGSCLRRALLDVLVPHINDEFFQDRDGYCQRNFAPVHISTVDDGLIRRVMAKHQMVCKYPRYPVCAHVGIRGLDQYDIYKIQGNTLEERIESTRKIIENPPNWRRYAPEWEPYAP